MSATKYADAGMAAIEGRKWNEAITSLTKAIDQSKSPQWLLSRSQAFMESGQLDKALRDAEFAYCTAAERGNDKSRKQMIEAQHRRSVVYFRKKQIANADACASWSQQLAKGVPVRSADKTAEHVDDKGFYHITVADIEPAKKQDSSDKGKEVDGGSADAGRFSQMMGLLGGGAEEKTPYDKDWKKAQAWRSTILHFLEALHAEDPARRITVKLTPDKPSLDDKDLVQQEKKHDSELEAAKAAASPAQVKSEPANGLFRSQMYQSDSSISVSLFMKFASKEDTAKVQVGMQPNLIIISGVPRDPSASYIVPHAAINPAKSSFRVATMKIEFNLAKAQPGKWPSFGREELAEPDPSSLPQFNGSTATESTPASAEPADNKKAKGPAYPTSARGGPKNWDNLAAAEDDDKDDEKDVDSFFKSLYKGATPDQQRAMMKSFQESNGTALSTDWASVSKETVKTSPPDGVEAKKW